MEFIKNLLMTVFGGAVKPVATRAAKSLENDVKKEARKRGVKGLGEEALRQFLADVASDVVTDKLDDVVKVPGYFDSGPRQDRRHDGGDDRRQYLRRDEGRVPR